jgi:Uma2 family endonuclease
MVLEKQHISLDELIEMGEDSRIEIVNGAVFDMPMLGGIHQIISANVFRLLSEYSRSNNFGFVFSHGLGYLMNSSVDNLKNMFIPDVSFVDCVQFPVDWDVNLPHPGAPNLAIEIVSPSDDPELIQTKIRTYLEQGTQEIWIVYLKSKEVHQHTSEKPDQSRIYRGSTSIDTETLFPEIEGLTTDAIFDLPVWAIKDKSEE